MAEGRASAWAAIGAVGLIAVVVAAAVVLLAPRATTEADEETGVETEVPTTLADGSPIPDAPDELRGLVDDPLVVADRRDEFPDGTSCDLHMPWDEEPELEAVFITPTAATGSMVGEASPHEPGPAPDDRPEAEDRPQQMRATCMMLHRDGRWRDSGGGGGTAAEPGPPGTSRSSGSSCCEGGHGTAQAEVSVAGDIAWLLQHRGPYWLAYPVDGLELVTIQWPFPQATFGGAGRPEPSRVRLIDSDGDIVVEQLVGR